MKRFSMFCFAACAVAVLVASAAAQEKFIPRRQSKLPGPPLSPQDAIKKMTVPEGFQVELVADKARVRFCESGQGIRRTFGLDLDQRTVEPKAGYPVRCNFKSSVALTSASRIPGSMAEWPALGTIT